VSTLIDYTLILSRKYPNTSWTLNGDDYDGLEWLDESPKPTKENLDAQWDTVKAEIKAEIEAQKTAKAAILEKLGLTESEAALLLK
jgi:hypothetical protein